MTRWKASAIHISISAAIGIVAASLFLFVWYPPPYFRAAGADELLLLLVVVDLCVGPLLTLIIFRPGKWGLKFDLFCIAILQSAALLYGLVIVLESRPIFLVAVLDRYILVSANEISDEDLANGSEPRFRSRSWSGPRLAAVEMPTDKKELGDLAFSALAGRDAESLPKYYRDFDLTGASLLKRAKPIEVLSKKEPENNDLLNAALQKVNRQASDVVWVPLQARKEDMTMLIDGKTGRPIVAIPIDPW
jgi:hypothetical protein